MRRRKDAPQIEPRIEGPFVPMLVDTMASPAWKAMSPYARVVYYTLKSRYGHKIRNNGRIYLSARDGAEETGFSKNAISRALRELQHYGFIVMTKAGCLGVEGKGVAPHWRLTELGYMHEPPTRDFLKWDGEMFHEQKSPAYYKRQKRSLSKLRTDIEKQNPVPLNGTRRPSERYIPVSLGAVQLPEEVSLGAVHINEPACTSERYVSRVNHYAAPDAVPAVPLVPTAVPDASGIEIGPITGVDDWDGLLPDQQTIDAYIAGTPGTGTFSGSGRTSANPVSNTGGDSFTPLFPCRAKGGVSNCPG